MQTTLRCTCGSRAISRGAGVASALRVVPERRESRRVVCEPPKSAAAEPPGGEKVGGAREWAWLWPWALHALLQGWSAWVGRCVHGAAGAAVASGAAVATTHAAHAGGEENYADVAARLNSLLERQDAASITGRELVRDPTLGLATPPIIQCMGCQRVQWGSVLLRGSR